MTPRKKQVVKFLEGLVGQRFNLDTLNEKLSNHFGEDIKVTNSTQARIDNGEDDDELFDWNLIFNSDKPETYGYFDIYMLPMRRQGLFYVTEVGYEFDGGED